MDGNDEPKVVLRRKKIVYVPPPKPAWTKSDFLKCPVGGTHVFANVPEIRLRGQLLFPEGEVVLRYGEHYGPHRGFGFQHIWREHFKAIAEHDAALETVRKEVARVLRPSTNIYYETGDRANVHRLNVGLVVVELRGGDNPYYSVVTGGFNPGNAKGSLVGALA